MVASILLATTGWLGGCHTKDMVGNEATVQGTVQVCTSCHGFAGRGGNPTFPILAGQTKEYLVVQLTAFRAKTRADPHAHTYMWGMAAKLDDATIRGVAEYFSQQDPAKGATGKDPALVARGATIFKNGIEAENVPACYLCHGEHAEGTGEVPRLAGQHSAYLERQMEAFRLKTRANDIMHDNVKELGPKDATAIAAYLATL
jgi:cytochrome c553